MIPVRYHREKDHELRSIFPVASPRGIPIIRPKPIINEGVIAISGLPASEKRTSKNIRPKKSKGFKIRPVKSAGMGNMKVSVAGNIAMRLIARRTMEVKMVEMTNPGKKILRLLPVSSSTGLSGVASREVIAPLAFSLIRGKLAKDQINVIKIKTGIK